jgi:hypothetical protein
MQTFDVEFTKDGRVFDEDQVESLAKDLTCSDLIVVAHGWNNDMAEAERLYDELLANIEKLLAARESPQAPPALRALVGREFSVCRVFWPSKRFADEDLIPGGGAASATAANDEALDRILDRLAENSIRLGEDSTSSEHLESVERAKQLGPQLADPAAQVEFVEILRGILDPGDASEDDGTAAFFTTDAVQLFEFMGEAVTAPGPETTGGATSVGAGSAPGDDAGGAAGLRDLLDGVKAAARRLANLATYLQMKGRAGTVGSQGLAPVLRKVRRDRDVRIHLVGHSFGGRLVTSAAHALDPDTPDVTLSLLQSAFSHNGLSADFGEGKPGAFRALVADHRASGPIIITHTKNDRAVGIAYPLASRISRQNAAGIGDRNDPYGGMGRNGAQHTSEATGNDTDLSAVGHDYDFARGKVYNLLADDFVSNHGDVKGIQIAYAILSAAAAV